jgi:hypothetical protein
MTESVGSRIEANQSCSRELNNKSKDSKARFDCYEEDISRQVLLLEKVGSPPYPFEIRRRFRW